MSGDIQAPAFGQSVNLSQLDNGQLSVSKVFVGAVWGVRRNHRGWIDLDHVVIWD